MNLHRQPIGRRAFLKSSSSGIAAVAIASQSPNVLAWDEPASRFQLSMHPYSVKHLFADGRLTLENYAEFSKDTFGMLNVEFAAENCGELLDSPERADAIREKSESIGVTNRILLCDDQAPLDVASVAERRAAVEHHRRWIDVAQRLGCSHLRVRASTVGDPQTQLKYAADGVGRLCDAAESSSVSVLLENLFGLSRNSEWLVELVEQIGPDRTGLIADFGNFDGDLYEGMEQILPCTKSLCTKSRGFDEDGNETTVDFGRMMQLVKASDFSGCIAIEHLGDDPMAGIRKSIALVNQALA